MCKNYDEPNLLTLGDKFKQELGFTTIPNVGQQSTLHLGIYNTYVYKQILTYTSDSANSAELSDRVSQIDFPSIEVMLNFQPL